MGRVAPSLALVLAGCAAPPSAPTTAPDASGPTWSEHIAPIVGARCVGCHRAGAIGTLPLDTWTDAADFAPDLATEVRARRMPPTLLHPAATCRPLRDAPSALRDDEYATVLRWINAGWPEGRAGVRATAPPPPPPLAGVDHVARMPVAYTPDAARPEDDRCFLVDPGLASDRFLTGYEVVPGAARAVHHVSLFALASRDDARAAAALDARDDAPGYPCFGGPGVDGASPLAIWKPGDAPTRFPAGSGLPLRAGEPLVLQVRYTLRNGAPPDQTAVRLQTAAAVPAPAWMVLVADAQLRLPPRTSAAAAQWEGPVPGRWVHGVAPVMLTMGRALRLEVHDDPVDRCLLDLPRWDHHWAGLAFFAAPVALPDGARARLTCRFDTRTRNEETVRGDGRGDEQCAAYLYVTDVALP
ncbi:MAG: hypothetical protein U0325_06595 [Polyangiales bacterium]